MRITIIVEGHESQPFQAVYEDSLPFINWPTTRDVLRSWASQIQDLEALDFRKITKAKANVIIREGE